jgi:hypothetical protein
MVAVHEYGEAFYSKLKAFREHTIFRLCLETFNVEVKKCHYDKENVA